MSISSRGVLHTPLLPEHSKRKKTPKVTGQLSGPILVRHRTALDRA